MKPGTSPPEQGPSDHLEGNSGARRREEEGVGVGGRGCLLPARRPHASVKPLGQRHPGILSSRPDGTVLLTLSTSTGWEVLAQALN